VNSDKVLGTTYIHQRLSAEGVVTVNVAEFALLFQISRRRARDILHRLAAKGVLTRLKRGLYVLSGFGGEDPMGDPLFLGTRLVEPSYVSFWTALNHYGWTEQAPRTILLATTTTSGVRRLRTFVFRYVRVPRRAFFGYRGIPSDGRQVPLADREKAMVDSLYQPRRAGGLREVSRALGEAAGALDTHVLAEYALRIENRSLASRLGFLLEEVGENAGELMEGRSRVYVKLDPAGPRRGSYDRRWRIVDNRGRRR
jgi:predicted transcriptional regulator of viral defense system